MIGVKRAVKFLLPQFTRVDPVVQRFLNIFRSTPEMLSGVCTQLESIIADVHANPAVVAVEEGSRDLMTRTYAHLAFCRFKQGKKPEALEWIAEQSRSYPEVPIVRAKFGSDLEDLYKERRAAEVRLRRGELAVEVNRPDAQIYINEFNRGQRGLYSGRHLPGKYRVLVRVGQQNLAYDVDVRPERMTKLDVHWPLERALTVTNDVIGVALTSATPVAEEQSYAIAMSRKAGGASSIVMFDITEVSKRVSVTAALYERVSAEKQTAQLSRRGRVTLANDNRDDERFDALAQFISKGVTSPHVTDVTESHRDAPVARNENAEQPAAEWSVDSPLMPGRVADKPSPPQRTARTGKRGKLPLVLIGAGAAAVIAGAITYAADEDDATTGSKIRTYTDTAPFGIGVGMAGVGAVATGLWIWHRRTASTPTVAVGRDGATVGWAASF